MEITLHHVGQTREASPMLGFAHMGDVPINVMMGLIEDVVEKKAAYFIGQHLVETSKPRKKLFFLLISISEIMVLFLEKLA
jgi:hypothetical protein